MEPEYRGSTSQSNTIHLSTISRDLGELIPFSRQSRSRSGGCGSCGSECLLSPLSLVKDKIEGLVSRSRELARKCFDRGGGGGGGRYACANRTFNAARSVSISAPWTAILPPSEDTRRRSTKKSSMPDSTNSSGLGPRRSCRMSWSASLCSRSPSRLISTGAGDSVLTIRREASNMAE